MWRPYHEGAVDLLGRHAVAGVDALLVELSERVVVEFATVHVDHGLAGVEVGQELGHAVGRNDASRHLGAGAGEQTERYGGQFTFYL